jgi:hypothetical protein
MFKLLLSCLLPILSPAISAYAIDPGQDYSLTPPYWSHISGKSALYNKDTSRECLHPRIVRSAKNGDIQISVPADAMERYRIRFYDEENILLFEIRQIRDPLLIVEKYNFRCAGVFQYEVYRDNELVEKNSFRINPM